MAVPVNQPHGHSSGQVAFSWPAEPVGFFQLPRAGGWTMCLCQDVCTGSSSGIMVSNPLFFSVCIVLLLPSDRLFLSPFWACRDDKILCRSVSTVFTNRRYACAMSVMTAGFAVYHLSCQRSLAKEYELESIAAMRASAKAPRAPFHAKTKVCGRSRESHDCGQE